MGKKVNIRFQANGIGIRRQGHVIWLHQMSTGQAAKIEARNSPTARAVEERAKSEAKSGVHEDIADLARFLMTGEVPEGQHVEIVDKRPGFVCPACDAPLDGAGLDTSSGLPFIKCNCGVESTVVAGALKTVFREEQVGDFARDIEARAKRRVFSRHAQNVGWLIVLTLLLALIMWLRLR